MLSPSPRWRGAIVLLALAAMRGCTNTQPRANGAPRTLVSPSAGGGTAPALGPALRVQPLPARFDHPVYLTAPRADPRVFVVEKGGLVRILRGDTVVARPFLDLASEVSTGGEQGLLSIAFSPGYARDGLLYADWTDRSGDTRVAEFRVDPADPGRVMPGSRRLLLAVDQPYGNHNGGLLLFDRSGMLLVGLGDGGGAGDPGNRAQDLGQLLGKVLRIDPRRGSPYAIPPDNPFVGRAGARPEVFLSGLRNPWRFSYDPVTGSLWIGDVGQGEVEEVDAVAPERLPGSDFGWRVREGDRRYSPGQLDRSRLRDPVAVYGHERGRCSITGGLVLGGRYYFGDYCSGEVWTLRADPGSPGPPRPAGFTVPELASFGVDGQGRGYVVSLSGRIGRLVTG